MPVPLLVAHRRDPMTESLHLIDLMTYATGEHGRIATATALAGDDTTCRAKSRENTRRKTDDNGTDQSTNGKGSSQIEPQVPGAQPNRGTRGSDNRQPDATRFWTRTMRCQCHPGACPATLGRKFSDGTTPKNRAASPSWRAVPNTKPFSTKRQQQATI